MRRGEVPKSRRVRRCVRPDLRAGQVELESIRRSADESREKERMVGGEVECRVMEVDDG